MSRLLVNPGTPQEWEIQLKPGVTMLGRGPSCDFQIEHGSVSGTHCQITLENGLAKLKDLGSTNGTYLDRAPVHEALLAAGQRIQLGSVELQYLADAVASDSSASADSRPAGEEIASKTSAAPRVALRVAVPETPRAEPPPPAPPAYLPDEYSVSSTPPAGCKYHPKSIARWLCTHCQLYFCDLCVTSYPGGTRSGRFCRRCSGECVALNVQLIDPAAGKRNFFAALPGALAYPLRGAGLWFVAIGALFYGFLCVMGYVARFSLYGKVLIIVRVVYAGYAIAFLQRVLQTAAHGDDDPPSWPDFTEFWQDILLPFLQAVALFAVCFGPAVALLIWWGIDAANTGNADPAKLLVTIPVALAGAVYFPMATLAVAMADSVTALNPFVVLPAIGKTFLQYLLILVLTGLIFAFWFLANLGFTMFLRIPIIPEATIGAVMFYLLMVWARALGLMYFATKDRLGWFSR